MDKENSKLYGKKKKKKKKNWKNRIRTREREREREIARTGCSNSCPHI